MRVGLRLSNNSNYFILALATVKNADYDESLLARH